jgi:hypothetical protein
MHAMAKALLEWETIDSDQIDDIMAGKPPRPPKDWTPRTGADILDIGGESTRPGPAVPLEEELARVLPVVRGAVALGVPVSVDTYKPEVMQAVLDLGADIVNDIWALRQPGAQVVARHPRLRCVPDAHARRAADHAGSRPCRATWCPGADHFLGAGARRLRALGVAAERIVLDPGIGFRQDRGAEFPCWRASANCWRWATRCWPAGRASRRWAQSPAGRWSTQRAGSPAWRRRCWRWSEGCAHRARARCARTTGPRLACG